MKFFIYIFFIFFCATLNGFTQTAEDYLKRANEKLDNNYAGSALNYAEQALKIRPCYIEAYWFMGDVDLLTYNPFTIKEAIKYYDAAIACKPDLAESYLKKANVYFILYSHSIENTTFYDSCLLYINKAFFYKPDFSDAYFLKALLYDNAKKYDEAISDYTKVIDLKNGDSKAYINRGLIKYLYKKDKAGACDDFNKALKLGDDLAYKYIYKYCD